MPSTFRLFAALVPPVGAVEHLDAYLEPRRNADPQLRWVQQHQCHVTLAFAAAAPEHLLDELTERVEQAAARRQPGAMTIAGGGAFPHADAARVLWAGLRGAEDSPVLADVDPVVADVDPVLADVDPVLAELKALARGCRAAFAATGIDVEGQGFRPHITVARLRRSANVTRWVRVLDAYEGPAWTAGHVELIASHLGEGPRRAPRYEAVATSRLGDHRD